MVIEINESLDFQEIDNMLLSLQPNQHVLANPPKPFQAEKFLGKVKWGEDALKYQKRIRNEWD